MRAMAGRRRPFASFGELAEVDSNKRLCKCQQDFLERSICAIELKKCSTSIHPKPFSLVVLNKGLALKLLCECGLLCSDFGTSILNWHHRHLVTPSFERAALKTRVPKYHEDRLRAD